MIMKKLLLVAVGMVLVALSGYVGYCAGYETVNAVEDYSTLTIASKNYDCRPEELSHLPHTLLQALNGQRDFTLVRALTGQRDFSIGLRSGEVVRFSSADYVVGSDYIRLEHPIVEGNPSSPSELKTHVTPGRPIELRLSEIIWLADSENITDPLASHAADRMSHHHRRAAVE